MILIWNGEGNLKVDGDRLLPPGTEFEVGEDFLAMQNEEITSLLTVVSAKPEKKKRAKKKKEVEPTEAKKDTNEIAAELEFGDDQTE